MTGLFFDTETTGVKTKWTPDFKPALVQLGAILQDLDTKRVLAEINLVNCEVGEIPEAASDVHGITTEMAKTIGIQAVLIDEVFARLMKKADIVVAHNINYDLDVVEDNMPRTQSVVGTVPTFDTMASSLYIVKAPLTAKQVYYFTSKGLPPDAPYKSPNLIETHQHFYGKPFEGAHDAMADIRACRDIFFTLIEQGYYRIEATRVVPTEDYQAAVAA